MVELTDNLRPEALNLLQLAASVEAKSEHPLAAAIVAEVKRGGLALFDCTDFQSISGKGASGLVGGRRISVGSIRYFETDARKFQRLLGLTGLVAAAQKYRSTRQESFAAYAATRLRRCESPVLRRIRVPAVPFCNLRSRR